VLTSQKNAWKKIFIFPLRYYANFVSTTVTVLMLHDVESFYFFYSNPVQTRFLAPELPEQRRIAFNFWRKRGWFVCAIADQGNIH